MRTFQLGWRARLFEWLLSAGALLAMILVGCEQKTKVLDIETPGLGIEIDKTDHGIEIETRRTPTEKQTDDKAAKPDEGSPATPR